MMVGTYVKTRGNATLRAEEALLHARMRPVQTRKRAVKPPQKAYGKQAKPIQRRLKQRPVKAPRARNEGDPHFHPSLLPAHKDYVKYLT
jgi:hypothetical protein